MFTNYLVGLLRNLKTGTWHPIAFENNPLMGPNLDLKRYKSMMHHSTGFANCGEALDEVVVLAEKLFNANIDLGSLFEWPGDDVPAMVVYVKDGKFVL